ncbi:MAG: hypothetical protein ACJ8AW_30545 [Rhodopila sp.]|jgi:hypothetical protein
MGEARRQKLVGTYPQQTGPLTRTEALTWAMGFLAATEDETMSGVTIVPASRPRNCACWPRAIPSAGSQPYQRDRRDIGLDDLE